MPHKIKYLVWSLRACDRRNLKPPTIGKCQDHPTHFTLELDGLRDLRKNKCMRKFIATSTQRFRAILHQAYLKEVSLTQNWETMTLYNLTTLLSYRFTITYNIEGPTLTPW